MIASIGVVPGVGTRVGTGVAGTGVAAALSCLCTALAPEFFLIVSQEMAAVTIKKTMPRLRVNFCRTVVVCAPKRLSVMPPPKAAPKPSFFGRCISTSRIKSSATRTSITSRILMRMDMAGA